MRHKDQNERKPLWRWFIYAIACFSALMAVAWLTMIQVGMTMGWSGRSDSHVASLIVFIILLPCVATVTFALKAIVSAQCGDFRYSATFGGISILLIPAVWTLLNAGVFG